MLLNPMRDSKQLDLMPRLTILLLFIGISLPASALPLAYSSSSYITDELKESIAPNPEFHHMWEKRAKMVLHTIGGDDFRSFYGFSPRVSVVSSHLPVAVISPKNRLVFSSGLISLIETPSEFAFVVAHEVAHEMLGHLNSHSSAERNTDQWSLKEEIAADEFALQLLSDTQFSKEGAVRFLRRLEGFGAESGVPLNELHPTLTHRREHLAKQFHDFSDIFPSRQ